MDFIFNDKPNELHFVDKENGREIIFIYREPDAEDRIKYGSAIGSVCRGKKIDEISLEDISKIQFQFGLEILTGFQMMNVPINISSDPESSDYHQDWKKLIGDRAPDLIMLACQQVFEPGGFALQKN